MCDAYCKGCGHYRGGSGAWTCEYLLDTGHRRPCPAGKDCTCHTKKDKEKRKNFVNPMAPLRKAGHQPGTPAPNQKIKPEKARELFHAGYSDAEIAAAFGAKEGTARRWRTSEGLMRKQEGGPGRPPKETNEEDMIVENEVKETPAAAPTCCQPGKAVDVWKEEQEPVKETPVTVADESDGMSVEQLGGLFGNIEKQGMPARVTVDGNTIKSVVVTLCYDAKCADGPSNVKVELKV